MLSACLSIFVPHSLFTATPVAVDDKEEDNSTSDLLRAGSTVGPLQGPGHKGLLHDGSTDQLTPAKAEE